MKRRELLRAAGPALLLNQGSALSAGSAQQYVQATRGLPPLKITNVKTFLTSPPYPNFGEYAQTRLVVVKVETNEPGLYGVGCASFCFRPAAVAVSIDKYLKPFAIGKDPDQIEDLWQSMNVSSLWRSGPVLNNALSGIDMALWDLKGKRANMPLYQLMGGKCRFAIPCYGHASGRDAAECAESVRRLMAEGYRHVRIEVGGLTTRVESGSMFGMPTAYLQDAGKYAREIPKLFEFVRKQCGEEVELLHDVHGELPPMECIQMIRRLEPFRPFFVEDPFLPEEIGYFKVLRGQTPVPLAIGEKFVNQHEFVSLIAERQIDFIRAHISAIGGLSRARKIATLCEWFGVRTAWHAPRDVSPVGHAANAHLDLAVPNFGIQERIVFSAAVREVFPGAPTIKDGKMYISDAPGLGIDIDEKQAAKYPHLDVPGNFGPKRRQDGTIVAN